MRLTINELPISIGEGVLGADIGADLAAAGFQRRGLLSRLLRKKPRGGTVFEAEDCTATCFDSGFELYPCTDSYLTPDRRWRTAANVLVVDELVVSAELLIIDARYAASEFVSRFREACNGSMGEPHAADRYIARWQNSGTAVTSLLRPDAKNACFVFEAEPTAART